MEPKNLSNPTSEELEAERILSSRYSKDPSLETKVVNLRKEKCDIKITRTKENKIPDPPDFGCFGNPYAVKIYGRKKCLELYKQYFLKRVQEDAAFKEAVLSLKGKILGCFCKPDDCHGDIIKEWLDAQERSE